MKENYDVLDSDMNCPNCGKIPIMHYVHWGEVKDYCKKCDLYFIYNKGDPFNTIDFVSKEHFDSQDVIQKDIKDMTAEEIVKNHITPKTAEERRTAIEKVVPKTTKMINDLLDALEHNDCNLYKHGTFMCDKECRCSCHWRNKIYKLGSFILPSLFKKKIRRYNDGSM